MMLKAESLVKWFGSVLNDSRTGQPSAKRFGMVLAITVLCGVMGMIGGVICGVTWAAHGSDKAVELVRIVSGSLEVIAGLVLAAVTTGYVGGMAVENKGRKDESADA